MTIDLLTRAFELACKEVVETDEQNCPGCPKGNKLDFPRGCNVPREKFWECWRRWFLREAEKAANGL